MFPGLFPILKLVTKTLTGNKIHGTLLRLALKIQIHLPPLLAYAVSGLLFKLFQRPFDLLVDVTSARVETGSRKLSMSGAFLHPFYELCVLGLTVDL